MNYLRTTGSFVIACHRAPRTGASVYATRTMRTLKRIVANEYSRFKEVYVMKLIKINC